MNKKTNSVKSPKPNMGYAAAKIGETIIMLATHEGRIKERLQASMLKFVGFAPDPFSERVRIGYSEIHAVLTTVSEEDAGSRGRFFASIDLMSEEEASSLASQLMYLDQVVREEYSKARQRER